MTLLPLKGVFARLLILCHVRNARLLRLLQNSDSKTSYSSSTGFPTTPLPEFKLRHGSLLHLKMFIWQHKAEPTYVSERSEVVKWDMSLLNAFLGNKSSRQVESQHSGHMTPNVFISYLHIQKHGTVCNSKDTH